MSAGMQSYAASREHFDLFSPHNVVAASLAVLCSVVWLGHTLAAKSEQAKRERDAQLAQLELAGEADKCPACQRQSRLASTSKESLSAGASGAVKKSKRDKKGKGVALPPMPTSTARESPMTRNAAVQTSSPPVHTPLRPYPPTEVLNFSRGRSIASSDGVGTADSEEVLDMSLLSPSSLMQGSTSRAPHDPLSVSVSRDQSVSSRSASTDVSSSASSSLIRRRSSSEATSLSVGSSPAAVLTPLATEVDFATSSSINKKSRKARQREREMAGRREVVGLPKASVSQASATPVSSVSRSNTLKATDAYWSQDPSVQTRVTSKPISRPASAAKNRSQEAVTTTEVATAVPSSRAPDRRPSVDTQTSSSPALSNASLTATTMPFSPPLSPSPARSHQSGLSANVLSSNSVPGSPSPSFTQLNRPPAYTATSYDAVNAAQQAAYLLAHQQAAYLQAVAQQSSRAGMSGGPMYPMMGMLPHPSTYGMTVPQTQPQQMNGFAPPRSQSRRPSFAAAKRSSSLLSLVSDGEAYSDIDKLREQVHRLEKKGKLAEIENERKHKELEIARWRLQCVEVERKQDDHQTQEAICFFVERAEAAEKRVKELETKLGISGDDGDTISIEGKAGSLAAPMDSKSPRPSSPAALASLERLDASLNQSMSPTVNSRHRTRSPSLLSPIHPVYFEAPRASSEPSPTRHGSNYRQGRRSGRRARRRGSTSPRVSSASESASFPGDDDEDEGDVVILLGSPAFGTHGAASGLLQPPVPSVTLGLGIQSSASSDAGDEAETEPEEDTQLLQDTFAIS